MTQPAGINWMKKLMLAFGTEERPVTPTEFKTFWTSCTDEQKAWYKEQVSE
jgi:hypothetical protein